jgi:hypothetical protein
MIDSVDNEGKKGAHSSMVIFSEWNPVLANAYKIIYFVNLIIRKHVSQTCKHASYCAILRAF